MTVDVPYVFCRRIGHHNGDHAAYTFSIREPERWLMTGYPAKIELSEMEESS
jgi:hypothetical protein